MSTTRKGFFLTFEGGEGAGKSTQLKILAERLRGEGRAVVETIEPGGTPIGAQIRRVLLDASNREMSAMTELLLMFAARAQNIAQVILPALEAGSVVLCDRFTDSTLAYQGIARGLGANTVAKISEIACGGLTPDLTLYLDIDAAAGLRRARARNALQEGNAETRLDDQSLEFHQKVRRAFLDLANREPERIRIISAAGTPEEVASRIWPLVPAAVTSR